MPRRRCDCVDTRRDEHGRCRACKTKSEYARTQRANRDLKVLNDPIFRDPAGGGVRTTVEVSDYRRDPSWGYRRGGGDTSIYTPNRADFQAAFNARHHWGSFEHDDTQSVDDDDRYVGRRRRFCGPKTSKNFTDEDERVFLATRDKARLPRQMRLLLDKEEALPGLMTHLYDSIREPLAYKWYANKTASIHVLLQVMDLNALVRHRDRDVTVLADPYAGSGWLAEGWFSYLRRVDDEGDPVRFRGARGTVPFYDDEDDDDTRVPVTVLYHHVTTDDDQDVFKVMCDDGTIMDKNIEEFWPDDTADAIVPARGGDDEDAATNLLALGGAQPSAPPFADDIGFHALDSLVSLRLGFYKCDPPAFMVSLQSADAARLRRLEDEGLPGDGGRFDAAAGGGVRFRRGYSLFAKTLRRTYGEDLTSVKVHRQSWKDDGEDKETFEKELKVTEITKGGVIQAYYGVDSNDPVVGVRVAGDGIVTSPSFCAADLAILKYYPAAEDAETKFAAFLLPSTFLTTRRKDERHKLPFRHRFFEYVKARVAVVKDVETFGAARDLSWFVVCASTETRDTLFPVECYHLEKMDHDEAFGYDREREENKLVIPDAYK